MEIFPQLFESVPDALIIVDDEGRIVMANGNAEQLFGYPRNGMNELFVEDLMPMGARERHRLHRSDYMRNPRVRPMGSGNMTLVGQRCDGQQFSVEIALSVLIEDDGRRFLASVRDISETQRARQALSRARYDAVVATIGQLAVASEGADVIERLPEILADALEVPHVAVVMLRNGDPQISASTPHSGADGTSPWKHVLSAPLQSVLGSAMPLIVQRQDDTDTPPGWPDCAASGAIVPLPDRERPMGALLALSPQAGRFDHDALQLLQTVASLVASMIQRRRTEEQLAHSQRLDAIGQLTGGIAHDFNNLLTVMSGSLQLLESDYDTQPSARKVINSALRSVTRGAELTSKLLAFARRQHLTPRAIDPATLLGDLKLLLHSTLGDAIRLHTKCPSDMPAPFADISQLESALVNLTLNARDAMPVGGEITISASEQWVTANSAAPEQRPGHYAVFSVADNGGGMTPEVQTRALEPFFTTKALGHGSGLGLSMVYGFVNQSGGHLRIQSEIGRGTKVELYLPIAGMEPYAGIAQAFADDVRGSETVLVVEDEFDVRQIAESFLKSLGYTVIVAGSAAEALEKIAGHSEVALMFSDVMLGGGMNGVELGHAAIVFRPDLHVLLTSGYEEPSAMAAMSSSNRFELLRKPYRREQLAVAVRRTLRD
ncbi:PAS domain S-box protein [Lysobacter sp. Root983]|uniref:PAS domain S-box protein n=1 Tax=Lysobacter sp. Root983 TaxID=1736613 RepID=UPI00070FAAD4|nr:PAS domain S-box protein [Lysobacter sp. Root983]KRD79746.1 hypothetical protein ASE43_02270 [Lysobacter sp. Root983]